jgi:HEAT repeat protein
MKRSHRFGTALVFAVAVCALAAARQVSPSGIFTCGQDESLHSSIPLQGSTIVLAGDGRLYSPCPAGNHGVDHREIREATAIGEGRYSGDAELRWRAAQAEARNSSRPEPFIEAVFYPTSATAVSLGQVDGLGGFIPGSSVTAACDQQVTIIGDAASPRRWQPGRLFFMLRELRGFSVRSRGNTTSMPTSPEWAGVRMRVAMEGAYAIGGLLSREDLDSDVITAATKELRACVMWLGDAGEAGNLILEDLGLPHYRTDAEAAEAENFLIQQSYGTGPRTLGALKGLEALIRQHPQRQIGESTGKRLRELVTRGTRTLPPAPLDTDARIRQLALLTLQHARALDSSTLGAAATDADWQMRRVAAANLDLSASDQWRIGEQLSTDAAFQVRYELLSALGRLASRTGQCAPILALLIDPSPIVVMHAMDMLVRTCSDLDEVIVKLTAVADNLEGFDREANWQVPARALAALARIKPAEAKSRLANAVKHQVWQVRAAAAAVSVSLGDAATAATLAGDREPNVQTAALDALFRLRSPAVVPRAIDALRNGDDHQLLRMAALVLKGLPESAKEDASDALLTALRTLTAQEADTSRVARVAILERLAETLKPARGSDVLPFLGDYDDDVRTIATKTYLALVPPPHPRVSLRRRYPLQPPLVALNSQPTQATIVLEDGPVTLRLLPDVAPVTVARFAELASRGYYNGLTFHRVVPNFFVQGEALAPTITRGLRATCATRLGRRPCTCVAPSACRHAARTWGMGSSLST